GELRFDLSSFLARPDARAKGQLDLFWGNRNYGFWRGGDRVLPSVKPLQNHWPELRDIPCAESQNHVSFLRSGDDGFGRVGKRSGVAGFVLTGLLNMSS